MQNQAKAPETPSHQTDVAAEEVLFASYPTQCGHLIGEMTLNSPKSLNALSVEMCQLMSAQLLAWQQDSRVVAVILRGAGDKAFCAGGNIRKLYDSMVMHQATADNHPSERQKANPYATEFFGSEYDLYRQMHFYPKPIILWGNGIVMGGGMGLMASCSHRVVTETTRFAMPEITIGLFPDATGSWFLQRMPAKLGLFLGLTGAQCNGSDALLVNLAEFALPSDAYQQMLQALIDADWTAYADTSKVTTATQELVADHHASATVSRALAGLSAACSANLALKPSKLLKHWQSIQRLMNCGGLEDIDAILQDDSRLSALDTDFAEDEWTQKAVATYCHGCPVTAALTYELYHQVAALSLEQILYLETNVAVNCANNPDFKEGVRALLIDKDKSPKWSRTLAECQSAEGQAYINSHFANPYPDNEHPFKEWLSDKAYGVKVLQ